MSIKEGNGILYLLLKIEYSSIFSHTPWHTIFANCLAFTLEKRSRLLSALEYFSSKLAEKIESCMWNAAWYAANERFGTEAEAQKHNAQFEQDANDFKELAEGVLSSEACDNIKNMFSSAAWTAANERKGYTEDAEKDKTKMDEEHAKLVGQV